MSGWENLGTVAPTQLIEARLETHHAAQWLARATRAYCTPVPDDSHTSLTWDSIEALLITQHISPMLSLGLRFHPHSLVALGQNRKESFSLLGQTQNDIQIWITEQLKQHQLDPNKLNAPAPYTLPSHPLDSGLTFGIAQNEAFEELGRYFGNAAGFLETLRQTQTAASPVRCWPHHFDIATLVPLDTEGRENARSIGIGMSPGDDTYSEPYFYISPWPYPTQPNWPAVMAPSFWHREGFTATILKSSDLAATRTGKEQQDQTTSILKNAIQVNLTL